MTKTKAKDERKRWAEAVAGIRSLISKKQDELDEDGIERKAIDLTPEIVDSLRGSLCEAFPDMCEGEGEAVGELMQVIVDALAEAQPESDIPEERAAGDEEDDKEDEEKNSEIIAMGKQLSDMGQAYNDLIADVSEVVDVTRKALESVNAKTKAYADLDERLAKVEKKQGQAPRRASQAPETELDLDSKLAKSLKGRDVSDVPEPFQDMYSTEGVS